MTRKVFNIISKGFLLLAIMFILASLLAYFRAPSARLKSIVSSGNKCEAPCWRDLIPEQTTKSDFDANPLQMTRFVIYDEDHLGNPIPYWIEPLTFVQAGVKFENDELKYIDFSPNYLRVFENNRLDLNEIITQLGTPDSYRAAYVEDLSTFIIVYLVYEEKGILIDFIILDKEFIEKSIQNGCLLRLDNGTAFDFGLYFVQPKPNPLDMLKVAYGGRIMDDMETELWQDGELMLNPCKTTNH